MKTLFAVLVCGILQVSFAASATSFANPVLLSEGQERHYLGKHLEILEDADGTVTFDQLVSGVYDERFIPCRYDIPNVGFTTSVYWVRVQIDNTLPRNTRRLLEIGSPFTDRRAFVLDWFWP